MKKTYEVAACGGPRIYPCPVPYEGKDPAGHEIRFMNYYMEYSGKPYFAASGEMHFSRIGEPFWEDEIIKMKMAGLTMISTYLFWIHHEEEKGVFDWSGSKNLRKFVELCKKQGIFVLLRVGPFSHGECRNGGLPDWMFGAPYDVRSNDEEYLSYVRRYFQEIGEQVKGLMFGDGGPVVGVQLENEYEHASSPWEMTTENSGEWTPSGNDGPSHLKRLKELAVEAGLTAPLYSTTAWGGACAPVDTVMPLWGGYAYRPWIFYGDDIKEHPATGEFIYRNFHSNQAPAAYNFDPEYLPEDFPFICCEMGGGMANYYRYRFVLPFESVEALANVKAAGGCNFLGYYMFHGGTNPLGKRVAYLNESGLPKMSYDYQAAVGEYGQIRDSYKRVKLLHYFFKCFEERLCRMGTYLPQEAAAMEPEDTGTLRYCVRASSEGAFLFLNNFQDHVEMERQEDFSVTVRLMGGGDDAPEAGTSQASAGCMSEASAGCMSEASAGCMSEASAGCASEASAGCALEASAGCASAASAGCTSEALAACASEASAGCTSEASAACASEAPAGRAIRIPAAGGMTLEAGASCVLPVHMDLDGLMLRYATAQPVLRTVWAGAPVYFFFTPEGMEPEFYFEEIGRIQLDAEETSSFRLPNPSGEDVVICLLNREDSLRFWKVERPEGTMVLLSDETVLDDGKRVRIESIGKEQGLLQVFPARDSLRAGGKDCPAESRTELFSRHRITYGRDETELSWTDVSSKEKGGSGALKRPVVGSPVTSTKITNARARLRVAPRTFTCCKQALITVDYDGDIGYAFIDGTLIHDHFANGAPWEFGIRAYETQILEKGIDLYVSPRKRGSRVSSESAMAARYETYEEAVAKIRDIHIVPVFDCETDL